jgi:hypothetical protein
MVDLRRNGESQCLADDLDRPRSAAAGQLDSANRCVSSTMTSPACSTGYPRCVKPWMQLPPGTYRKRKPPTRVRNQESCATAASMFVTLARSMPHGASTPTRWSRSHSTHSSPGRATIDHATIVRRNCSSIESALP